MTDPNRGEPLDMPPLELESVLADAKVSNELAMAHASLQSGLQHLAAAGFKPRQDLLDQIEMVLRNRDEQISQLNYKYRLQKGNGVDYESDGFLRSLESRIAATIYHEGSDYGQGYFREFRPAGVFGLTIGIGGFGNVKWIPLDKLKELSPR